VSVVENHVQEKLCIPPPENCLLKDLSSNIMLVVNLVDYGGISVVSTGLRLFFDFFVLGCFNTYGS
jgi:hypothetical protein